MDNLSIPSIGGHVNPSPHLPGLVTESRQLFRNALFEHEPHSRLSESQQMLFHRVQASLEDQLRLADLIPSPPQRLILLLNEVNSDHADFDKISAVVANDTSLTGEIIRVSNGPLYRTRMGEITSLNMAIAMIGLDGIAKIASALLMRDLVSFKSQRCQQLAHQLWRHSLRCADACEQLHDPKHSLVHYLLGLVHDVGSIVVLSALMHQRLSPQERDPEFWLPVALNIMEERASWLSALVTAEWGLPETYLETLNEYGNLLQSEMTGERYELRSDTAKALETGVLVGQVYQLVLSRVLDKDSALTVLAKTGVGEIELAQQFDRFEHTQS